MFLHQEYLISDAYNLLMYLNLICHDFYTIIEEHLSIASPRIGLPFQLSLLKFPKTKFQGE